MSTERKKDHDLRNAGFSTRSIHSGSEWNESHSISPPIFQSTTFRLDTASAGGDFAVSTAPAEFYTRWGNPTTKQAEAVISELEGAERTLLFGSGMGAIGATMLALLQAGDHVLVGRSIYSGTHEIASGILPRYGVESGFVDPSDLEALGAAIQPNTKLIVVESPTNPSLEICDLAAIAEIARGRNVLTAVDNTFATPYNQNPIALGFDLVMHAATKALGGHSDVTAGSVSGSDELVSKIWKYLKLFGACLSPFEAWLLIRGLKTLELRAERQNASALRLAKFLNAHSKVERVYYPGLESHPGHELAKRQMRGFGGILSFELNASTQASAGFAESLHVVQLAVSLGGTESLIQHPASMTHGTLSDEDVRAAGISPGLLRLSVGLENVEDLEKDLETALGGL
ncbi:MAG: PLP-dependent aspartate aminotransferase family protein [Planctomycetota bacterium]